MRINGKSIDEATSVYVIAELSANHNGSYERAVEIIHAAAEAGADAVKLQTYTADTITLDCDDDIFRIGPGTPWEGRKLYDLYDAAHTPWEWHADLKMETENLGMDCFSSPFDENAVDFLETLDVPAYKIASFELVDIPLIKYAASKGRPMIMSTGMATLEEIEGAVEAARSVGNDDIALLKCVSAYPATPEDMNLATIPDMADRFGVMIGLSDHTLSNDVAVAAVALGAKIVEKHLTLSRDDGGFDSPFSLEPEEFREMVRSIRTIEKALGKVNYRITEKEKASRQFRKSLFAVKDIKAGDEFTPENMRSIRPRAGLSPKYYEDIIAKHAKCDIARGTPLKWDMIAEPLLTAGY